MSEHVPSPPVQALVRLADHPPTEMPAIVLDDLVPFPGPVVPLLLDREERREAALHAKHNTGFVVLINQRGPRRAAASVVVEGDLDGRESLALGSDFAALDRDSLGVEPAGATTPKGGANPRLALSDLAPVGISARLVRVLRLPDERLSALVQLVGRVRPLDILQKTPFPILRVMHPHELSSDAGAEFQATYRQLRLKLQAFFEAHPHAADELKLAGLNIEPPSLLTDFVAQHLSRDYEERMAFLCELDVGRRLSRALEVTLRELDLLTVGNRISNDIRDKVERHQREFLLREQMKAIRTELGEEKDPAALAVSELTAKLAAAGLPPPARARADEELKRLQLLPAESPEHNVVRSYLDWIAVLPWSKLSSDRADLVEARAVLDADHFGLDEVKERILEFLAVRQLNPDKAGSLLCFAGPPGVGKTSLGKSIANALGRQFHRLSVGGMRDEAEIKGHRRTYIGAMPGRILQGLKSVGTANPVFMLDELDKMGADWRGDPSSALLEVLDPAQNQHFSDHYLDLAFDLSRVMFIATVNIKTEIPEALRDRLEVIDLPGYIPEEKLQIASRYLFPRQRRDAGLAARQLSVSKSAIERLVREYTHEAGVRELERQLGRICRKRASEVVGGKRGLVRVGRAELPAYLGPPKIQNDRLERQSPPGVAVGLAWTPAGGDVLFIEAVRMPGKGQLKVTGQLGEVMSESAALALSYVRSHAATLGIDPQVFADSDFHLHFPAGAVKKDGPSAGITVTAALISLLTGQSLAPRLAMTGEMTLRGEVLPVGGIREKVVAARRAGVKRVLVPGRNRADVEEIPLEVRRGVSFSYASTFDEVLQAALPKLAARGRHRAIAGASI
jgi:ATP-dependent Lon protease